MENIHLPVCKGYIIPHVFLAYTICVNPLFYFIINQLELCLSGFNCLKMRIFVTIAIKLFAQDSLANIISNEETFLQDFFSNF